MLGHKGGIIATCIGFWKTAQYFRLAVDAISMLVIGIGIIISWVTNKKKQSFYAFFIFVTCSYISWVTTTPNFHDYHSSWLVPALMMTSITCVVNLSSKSIFKKTFYYGLLVLPLLLGTLGFFLAFKTLYENPRVNVYDRELRLFDSRFELSNSTVFGRREIMWYFHFNHNIVFPLKGVQEYYIGRTSDFPDDGYIEVCDRQYKLMKREKEFALYRRINGSR